MMRSLGEMMTAAAVQGRLWVCWGGEGEGLAGAVWWYGLYQMLVGRRTHTPLCGLRLSLRVAVGGIVF